MSLTIEEQYTIKEVAGMLKASMEKTRLIVKDEPGVLRFFAPARRGVRPKAMYRIPASVVERILRRSANPS
jgi:hypothetical protein